MQHIDIPAPSGADNETVITALETAALFRSKGDGQEAMRWLRRAAESAGEVGDDARALVFSRVVAELHDELEAAPPPPSAPYPPPPSARASRPPSSSPRTSYPPRPSSRPLPSAPPPLPVSSVRPAPEPPQAIASATTPEPPQAIASAPSPHKGARHSARVAVEISTTKPGVLELRLLADGDAPRIGCSEALLVMLDPTSQLLSR